MASPPIIGIAMQTLPAKERRHPSCWVMGQQYVEAVRAVGGVPWLIPLFPDDPNSLDAILERLDGIYLAGGMDVDPSRYREPRLSVCGESDPARDAVEIHLVEQARERGLPVLAVCRGLQILNVAYGGTLYQDVPSQVPAVLKHNTAPRRTTLAHDISIKSRSRLSQILNESRVPVNSLHHQAIKDLAPGLAVTAYADDGIIEAVEGQGERFLVAVQWHPEEMIDTMTGMKRLFAAFVEAAKCD